jgi:uncharacterized protein YlxP (DUF503 family)
MTIKYFILMMHSLFSINVNKCSNNQDATKITVVGIAIVIKHHAAVQTDDSLLYYLDGIDNWDVKYKGKRVKVTGKLVIQEYHPIKSSNPEITVIAQPRLGNGRLITKPKWRLVQ